MINLKNILTLLILTSSITLATPLNKDELAAAKKGTKAFNKILSESTISQDSKTLNRIKEVGQNIAQHVDKEYDWKFTLIENKALNAFCLPGGKVVFFTGMFKAIENDDQLAAVMSHEIAHVLLHHSSMRAKADNLADIPKKLGKGLFGDLIPKDLHVILDKVHSTGKNITVLMPYAREQESEADSEGVKLMIKAGYNPQEAIKLWGNIKTISKNTPEIPEFLSTHPNHDQRIITIKNEIANSKK